MNLAAGAGTVEDAGPVAVAGAPGSEVLYIGGSDGTEYPQGEGLHGST